MQIVVFEDAPVPRDPKSRFASLPVENKLANILRVNTSAQITSMQAEPETYYLHPTRYVPNSKLPVLLYRGVLGSSPTPESIRSLIEPNKWIRGGQWKTYPTTHFHSVSHECYAVFQGKSTFRLGKSPIDPDSNEQGERLGHEVLLERGDIIVLPVSQGFRSPQSSPPHTERDVPCV